jgi:hypothetical protein
MNANAFRPRDLRIIEAYTAGVSIADIARDVGMTAKGVEAARRRLGIPVRKQPRANKWTDDFKARVIDLYKSGASYTQIGCKLGITRNAACGILFRAGVLKTRMTGIKRTTGLRRKGEPKKLKLPFDVPPKMKKAKPLKPRPLPAEFLGIDIFALTSKTCRNPNPMCDDPRAMTYCGQPVFGTLPYCEACAFINYRPADAHERAPRPR